MPWSHWRRNRGQDGFSLQNLPSSFRIWSKTEAIMFKTWTWTLPETVSIYDMWRSFKAKPKAKFECLRKMTCKPKIMPIIVSTLYDENWPELFQFKNLAYFLTWWRHFWRHECKTHNVHNYTPSSIPRQNIVSVAFVVVKSSGQASWQTHIGTWTPTNIKTNKHKHTGWKHCHIAIAGDNHHSYFATWIFFLGINFKYGFKFPIPTYLQESPAFAVTDHGIHWVRLLWYQIILIYPTTMQKYTPNTPQSYQSRYIVPVCLNC